jgi:hypothetical protein
MKPVKKTYSKVLLMMAAVVVALILGFVFTLLICSAFWHLAKPQGYLNAEIIWSSISAVFASITTYLLAYLFVIKCGWGKIKWLNILCYGLTLLWCLLWAGIVVLTMEEL